MNMVKFIRDYGQLMLAIVVILGSIMMFVVDKPSRAEEESKDARIELRMENQYKEINAKLDKLIDHLLSQK